MTGQAATEFVLAKLLDANDEVLEDTRTAAPCHASTQRRGKPGSCRCRRQRHQPVVQRCRSVPLDQGDGLRIVDPVKVFEQCAPEQRLVRQHVREQRHRRSELEVVGRAEYL